MAIQLMALNSPVLRCISVNQNGSISLSWSLPTDISGFNSYHIFRSLTVAGPFIKIDSLYNVNQLNYNDFNINANNQSVYYYILSKSTANIFSNAQDTLRSIYLSVTNTGTGIANLNWNPVRQPLLTSSSAKYLIFRKNGTLNTWTKIDSVSNLSYNDTINVCRDTVYYRIEIKDNTACTSVSSIDKKLFEDLIAPITYGIDTVSVDNTNGRVKIGWRPSTSNDVMGYIICHGSPCIALDTVWGKLSSSYTDIKFDPCAASQGYKIAVFDSCFNTSLFSNIHNSIYLSSKYSKCENKIFLNWTPYINMSPGISGYRVMLSKNGNAYSIYATLSSNVLNYTIDNLDDSTIYCFYIQAYENTTAKTSSSCIKCFHIIKSLNPEILYIRTSTVAGENHIEVKVFTDTKYYISGYKIYRSESLSGIYNQIASIPYAGLANFSYHDYNVNSSSKIYYYKIVSVDSCGNTGKTSNVSHTILLEGSAYDSYTNQLQWTEYGDWEGNVEKYDIYRSVSGSFSSAPVASILAGTTGTIYQYLDNVENFISGNGRFEYFVQAVENSGSVYNFAEVSNSNVVQINQQPEIYVPNAFSPEGINKIFKPVSVFLSSENYSMQIFNRFGQLVFETNNPNVGWDGKMNNEYVKQGVYFYVIYYSFPSKKIVQKKGTVTVIF